MTHTNCFVSESRPVVQNDGYSRTGIDLTPLQDVRRMAKGELMRIVISISRRKIWIPQEFSSHDCDMCLRMLPISETMSTGHMNGSFSSPVEIVYCKALQFLLADSAWRPLFELSWHCTIFTWSRLRWDRCVVRVNDLRTRNCIATARSSHFQTPSTTRRSFRRFLSTIEPIVIDLAKRDF